jgi:hydroxypyruvate isomerase
MSTVTLRFAPNLNMLYTEVPFLDRIARAAAAGFSAVEFLFPYDEGVREISTRVRTLGVQVVLFDVPPGDMAAGELGLLSHPDRREAFRRSLDEALRAARYLNCPRINVLAGNRLPGLQIQTQLDCALENLTWAAQCAADGGVTLLIEPLNPYDRPDYLIHTPQAALEIVRQVNHPRVRLQYDVYHAQLSEGNLMNTIRAAFLAIDHVQIADVPGRHEPGTGEINYPAVLGHLVTLGYGGYVGLEYVPSHDTDASLSWLSLMD